MQAKFYDGRSKKREEVQIDILSDRIVFRKVDGTGLYDWFFRDLEAERISSTIIIVHNRLISDARLEIEGSNLVRQLEGKFRFRLNAVWAKDTKLLTGLIVGILLITGALFWFFDEIASEAIMHIPRGMERKFFSELETNLKESECGDEKNAQIIEKLFRKLTSIDEQKEFHPLIIKDKMVNAFAIPGGDILVTTGLIKEIYHSDELAGVLAHEIEHQAQRHIAKAWMKASLVTIVGSLIGGRLGDVAGFLTKLKFSRHIESQADRGAARRLDQAQISRMGFVNFLRRLKERAQVPQILSTHPLEGREDQLLDNYDTHRKWAPSLTDWEFKMLKSMTCQ